ncbi:hypothetical protein D1AOALGA4SA_10042 [Olavius algarvensis Delta 1 endosymbiont]|nr:hypothetical protein D1AOALGA4SA_10042 [Olavius algarvensis Delta 1 endosymbiont]
MAVLMVGLSTKVCGKETGELSAASEKDTIKSEKMAITGVAPSCL